MFGNPDKNEFMHRPFPETTRDGVKTETEGSASSSLRDDAGRTALEAGFVLRRTVDCQVSSPESETGGFASSTSGDDAWRGRRGRYVSEGGFVLHLPVPRDSELIWWTGNLIVL
jgi:hypothetical protein